jgi:Putative Flp pilus-assembly TadE/G-like
MKVSSRFRKTDSQNSQSGQAIVFSLLAAGIFLIGAMAFAVDLGNLWFRRQAAQTAADAACTAGAMDLLVDAVNGKTNQGHFTAGSSPVAFDCNDTTPNPNTPPVTSPSPCVYAALNGFNASISHTSTAIGNSVYVDFPGTVAGITAPPSTIAPTAFMRVKISDNSPTFFAGMLGLTKQNVGATSICGVDEAAAPIPILVLDPQSPKSTPPQAALNIQGNGAIQIFGGPQRSIQDNSGASAGSCGQSNCSVNSPWGSATIDLSHAGPLGNGADMAISGNPSAAMTGFNGGSAGHWIAPAAPIADPFAQVCYPGQTSNCTTPINTYAAPGVPGAPSGVTATNGVTSTVCTAAQVLGGTCVVRYTENGCPDSTSGCVLYEPGAYPSGITVKKQVAIFDPGLYYITTGLSLQDQSIVRPGSGVGDGSGGTTFYFNGTGTVSVTSNAGTNPASDVVDSFNSLKGPSLAGIRYPGQTTTSPYYYGVQCINTGTGASAVPSNLQGGGAGISINGNILMGPCTGYYGDPLGTAEPASIGEQRWFLFFQDRSAQGVTPGWGGGGQFLLAGTMYFHSCNSTGSGVSCTPPPSPPTTSSYYQDIFSLNGNSGAGTYVLGEIVTDNLTLGGTSGINMDLNPTSAFNILKASLYQ